MFDIAIAVIGFIVIFCSFVYTLICTIREYMYVKNLIKSGVLVDAVVVCMEEELVKIKGGKMKTYSLTVGYMQNKIKFETKLNISTLSFKHKKQGDVMPIRFFAEKPQEIRYAKKIFLLFWIYLIGTLVLFAASFVALYFGILPNV